MRNIKLFLIPALVIGLAGCSLLPQKPGGGTNGSSRILTAGSPSTTLGPSTPATKDAAEKDRQLLKQYENRMVPGTLIQGVDVAGMTKEEAKAAVTQKVMDPLKDRKILFRYNNEDDYFSYKRLKVQVKESVFEEALANGTSNNPAERLKWLKEGRPLNVPIVLDYDAAYIDQLAKEVQGASVQSDRLHIAKRVDGRIILRDNNQRKAIDLEAFRKKVISAMTLSPQDPARFEAPIKEVSVGIDQNMLDQIDTRLVSVTTDYSWSVAPRKFNVKLAADRIDNSPLLPGDEFSFNRTIGGAASTANGFAQSMVYFGTDSVLSAGGGVCQVSSTLYTASLRLGLLPTQRSNHSQTVGYLPFGMDATIYAPDIDFRFKNTYEKPIFITTYADGDELTINIYGPEDLMGGYTYEYESEKYRTFPYKTREITDSSIPKGAVVAEAGHPKNGYAVRLHKLTLKNGSVVKREVLNDDIYDPVDIVHRLGTGVGSQIDPKWEEGREVIKYPPQDPTKPTPPPTPTKPETKPVTKPVTKPQTKPMTKPETKPVTKPDNGSKP
ncbi:Vancomycin B-type resistance protein VanW [Clostridiaceae bacterium JG1575]|nr:Vancomycin B-type resistance protein VanW [Clostridiaceae bacterium JG1575]